MRKVTENINEGLCHLATHIQVGVFVLEQLDCVLDRTVRSQVLHDFTIDVEEYFYFIFGHLNVLVFLIELNGGV